MKRKIVSGEGPKNAKIMFIGEAPGYDEVKQGRPFVGRAGRFLNELLKKNNIQRKNVFITNVVKVGLPKNRKPNKREINEWLPQLNFEIHTIEPKMIILLGDTALKAFFPKQKISKIHGKRIKRGRVIFIPTYHPSAAMRFPKMRKAMIEDFKKIKNS